MGSISDYHARGEKIFHSKSIAEPTTAQSQKPDSPAMDRISDLQDRLKRQYALLKQKEFALDTEAQVTKGEVRLLIQQLKQEIVGVEKEYTQRLVQQIKRQELPESIAQKVVGELVDEIEFMQPIARTDEMRSMFQQILEELRKPGTPAAAKLKVVIPIIPNIVSYEIEGDTETVVRRLFPTFVKAYEAMRSIAGN